MEVLVDKGKAKAIGKFFKLNLRQNLYPLFLPKKHELKEKKKTRPIEFQYPEDEANPGMRENQTSGQSG